jgi:hypothetical protein
LSRNCDLADVLHAAQVSLDDCSRSEVQLKQILAYVWLFKIENRFIDERISLRYLYTPPIFNE